MFLKAQKAKMWTPKLRLMIIFRRMIFYENIPRFGYRYPLVAFFRLLKGGGICRILKKSSSYENLLKNTTVNRFKTASKAENFTIVYIIGKHIYERFFPLENAGNLDVSNFFEKVRHLWLLIFRCRF